MERHILQIDKLAHFTGIFMQTFRQAGYIRLGNVKKDREVNEV
jgi:hypothetical protein